MKSTPVITPATMKPRSYVAGMHHAEDKVGIVLRAPADLGFSLKIKRERMQAGPAKGYRVLGQVETIVFENDRACQLDTPESRALGRKLYWPEGGPWIARTMPEEDLIFTHYWNLPLPKIPAAEAISTTVKDGKGRTAVNGPYLTDRHGKSHLAEGQAPLTGRMVSQRLEEIASAKHRRFLIFQPVAQIILLTVGGAGFNPEPKRGFHMRSAQISGNMRFATFGNHRMPLSALTGVDGRKLAILVDPYTGEAYFTGGRYQYDLPG